MKYTLSKKIINKIIEEEIQKTGISVNVLPITTKRNILEIIKDEIIIKFNDCDETITECLKNIITAIREETDIFAITDYRTNTIKIFLDEIAKENIHSLLFLQELVIATYHEYNHKLTWSVSHEELTFESFVLALDQLTKEISNLYNTKYACNFYEEIIANNYAINKAITFFKRYKNIYPKLENFLKAEEFFYKRDIISYDPEQFINYIYKVVKKNQGCFHNVICNRQFLDILYNIDGSYKDIKTLLNSPDFQELIDEIKYTIIASKSYLTNLDYNTLTKEELSFVLKALIFNNQKEMNRYTKLIRLQKEIDKFKEKTSSDLSIFKSEEFNMPESFHRNFLKITYQHQEITKITKMLNQKKRTRTK